VPPRRPWLSEPPSASAARQPCAAHGGACDALGRFVERDRPFEAVRPRDQHPYAAPGRFCGDPGFVRLSETWAGGGNGRALAQLPVRA
jgi:hypothetical protein